ncbi:hypothetical protein VMCG_06716 [Cytospora schulzeri]|uniref:Uncharacterized protein n=1 Tax=Cytospora schulzeri TaxID=448051 RepID=A0A423W5W3_9PEZI|nr:hypothetical protein VMCG_06716 [Valsa malicola]
MEPQILDSMKLADEMLREAATYQIHFHGIDGASQFQVMSRPKAGIMQSWDLPLPDFVDASQFMKRFSCGAMPWEPSELVKIYSQVVRIIKKVDLDLTVLKWTVLAPSTIKEFAVPLQPYVAVLWKYPVIGSTLPNPIPWHLIPMNVGLVFILASTIFTDTRLKTATKLLQETMGNEKSELITVAELGVVRSPPPGVRILCAMS